jgi:hypothetical protein
MHIQERRSVVFYHCLSDTLPELTVHKVKKKKKVQRNLIAGTQEVNLCMIMPRAKEWKLNWC